MDKPIYRLIALLVVYVPLENLILKYLPVPNFIYSLLRFVPELILYGVLIFLLHFRMTCKQSLNGTLIDKYVFLFLISVSCSSALNNSGLIETLFALRPILRYLTIFYLLINIRLDEKQMQFLLGLILFSGALQVFFGLLQYLGGPAVSQIFYPKASNFEVGGQIKEFILIEHGREVGSVFGTLGDTVTYGVFINIILVVFLSSQRNIGFKMGVVIASLISVTALSYSRASTFAGIIAMFIWIVRTQSKNVLMSFIPIAIIALGIGAASYETSGPYINPRLKQQSISENLTKVFSEDYLERAKSQRLGLLVGVLPAVLSTRAVFGFGPNQIQAIANINRTKSKYLTKVWTRDGFKDVYWVALVSFFGVIGTGLFILIFASLATHSIFAWNTYVENPLIRSLALCTFILIVITSFLMFFVRVVEFRAYSFYFWCIAGIFLSSLRQLKTSNIVSPQPVPNKYLPKT